MAAIALCRVSLGRLTAGKYIRPTMDLVMSRSDSAPIDGATLADQIVGLFNTPMTPSTAAFGSYLAPSIDRTTTTPPHKLSIYDLDGHLGPHSPVGPPFYEESFVITPPALSPISLADETAICVSYEGDMTGLPEFVGTTRPASRNRGRIYLGPLCYEVLSSDSYNDPVVLPAAATNISDQMAASLVDQTPPRANLQVWSRVNEAITPVLLVWVNNLFDTRRRRGARRVGTKTFGS